MAYERFKKIKDAMQRKEAKVFLIRHGSTDLNGDSSDTSVDRIRGWIDVPLNDKGREDAKLAAKKLKKEMPSVIYSSDLSRAKETAHIIEQENAYKAPIVLSKDLRPWNLGIYQGQETKSIIDELNSMVKFDHIIPKDGESFEQFRTRFLSKLSKIIEQAIKDNSTIFITTHYRNLKTCEAWTQAGMNPDLSINIETMITDTFKTGEVYSVDIKKYEESHNAHKI